VFADSREIEHEDVLESKIVLIIQIPEVHVSLPGRSDTGQVVFPIRPPLDPHWFIRDQGFGTDRWLVFSQRAGRELLIIIGPWLVIVIQAGHVGIVENGEQLFRSAAGLQGETAAIGFPAATVPMLILPCLGIAYAGLGFHIVVPDVFSPGPVGPDVLAGDAAGMAADALVQVHDHGNLSLNRRSSG
jgi:hypothetical protein